MGARYWEEVSDEERWEADEFFEDLMGRARTPIGPERYDEDHRSDRVAQFTRENSSLPADRRNIVLFGSSSMEGNFPTWPARHIRLPNVLNRGIYGESISQLETRLPVSVLDARPSHVFILNGRNDLWSGRSASTILPVYRRVIDTIRTRVPDVVVCIVTCAPVYNRAERIARDVIDLNTQLLSMATSISTWAIDLHSFLADAGGLMRPEYRKRGDVGMHFSEAGYQVFGDRIRRTVELSNASPMFPLAAPQPQVLSWHPPFR